jgi:hypothetical protein
MDSMKIGISAEPEADRSLLRGAGIGWMRFDFPFPFEDRHNGPLTQRYRKARAQAEALVRDGIGLLGITPLPGYGNWEPGPDGELRLTWHGFTPAYMGRPGSEEFTKGYHDLCGFLARDLKGIVPMWQILNEMEVPQFAGPLDLRQACDLVLACARGYKEVDPSLLLGANPAGEIKAYYLYGYLYRNGDPLDYCGADGYYGSWHPGGAETWDARIDELHAMTGKKVLLNEWGFSSVGGVASPEEHESGKHVCALKKWHYTWGDGHTPESQAAYVRVVFDAIRKHRDVVIGTFFYRLDDQPVCGQCHQPDCPAETGWGIVDASGKPKPAYHAFAEGAARLAARADGRQP